MKSQIWIIILKIAGLSQVLMAFGSLFLPRLLHWKVGLASMPILLRQMFWVYAAYILVTNISLGLVSIFFPYELLSGNVLGVVILSYTALYWWARVGIQFFYFDKKAAPKGFIYKLGEIALDANFIALALIYDLALVFVVL